MNQDDGILPSGWDAGLGALLLFARSGGPLIGGIAEKVAGDGETSYPDNNQNANGSPQT